MQGSALLLFIMSLRGGEPSEYNAGYNAALDDIVEFIKDLMWEEGDDDESS